MLLKGRNHYLCKAKFEKESGARLIAPSVALERLWAWAERTETGDRAELDFTPRADDWETLDADADDCVGEYCHRFADCHFFAKRDAARFADIVVVNHALFFLDLASGGALLPAYDFVVLDEAHQAEKYATAALTATLSPVVGEPHDAQAAPHVRDPRPRTTPSSTKGCGACSRRSRACRATSTRSRRTRAWSRCFRVLRESFYRLENWVHANWKDGLRKPIDNEAEAERRARPRAALGRRARRDGRPHREARRSRRPAARSPADEIEAVAWVERGDGGERYEVNAAPFQVADFLRATLFARTRSVVLTSATISAGGSFEFLRSSLGIDDAQQLVAPSPFDYAKQARLYVAPPRLNPKAADFARRAAPLIEEILDRTGGRAFVLFTSYARLREVYALLRERLPFPTQGARRSAALGAARLVPLDAATPCCSRPGRSGKASTSSATRSRASSSTGCRFRRRREPLVAARIAALEAQGRSGFEHYMIPSAIVRLKQGFGRLIRSTTDRGVVALLDGRAASMRYGATIVDALPPATRIDDLAALDDALRGDGRMNGRAKAPRMRTRSCVRRARFRSPHAVRRALARLRRGVRRGTASSTAPRSARCPIACRRSCAAAPRTTRSRCWARNPIASRAPGEPLDDDDDPGHYLDVARRLHDRRRRAAERAAERPRSVRPRAARGVAADRRVRARVSAVLDRRRLGARRARSRVLARRRRGRDEGARPPTSARSSRSTARCAKRSRCATSATGGTSSPTRSQPLHVTVHFNGWNGDRSIRNPERLSRTRTRSTRASKPRSCAPSRARISSRRASRRSAVSHDPILAQVGAYLAHDREHRARRLSARGGGRDRRAQPGGDRRSCSTGSRPARRDARPDRRGVALRARTRRSAIPAIAVRDVESGAVDADPRERRPGRLSARRVRPAADRVSVVAPSDKPSVHTVRSSL